MIQESTAICADNPRDACAISVAWFLYTNSAISDQKCIQIMLYGAIQKIYVTPEGEGVGQMRCDKV